jgi:hypothetical protein
MEERASHYKTDQVLVLFGDDFRYMNAFQNYRNMDNMISYMNKYHGDRFLFKYSTPSEYVDAVAKADIEWPTKYDDMFPYSDNPDSYWTGYFTSRPNDKEQIRRASSNYHASSQLLAQHVISQEATLEESNSIIDNKNEMMDTIGIVQHHDAISGTAKQYVADDYAMRVARIMDDNAPFYSQAIEKEINLLSGYKTDEDWAQCFKTNSTYVDCPIAKYEKSKENYEMAVAV